MIVSQEILRFRGYCNVLRYTITSVNVTSFALFHFGFNFDFFKMPRNCIRIVLQSRRSDLTPNVTLRLLNYISLPCVRLVELC